MKPDIYGARSDTNSASDERPSADYCPKNDDHKHRDNGGMFFFGCRDCGWTDADSYGGDGYGDYPRLGR